MADRRKTLLVVDSDDEARESLTAACARNHFTLRLAEKSLCTDNAAMVGILAERKLIAHAEPTDLDAEINPSWQLS